MEGRFDRADESENTNDSSLSGDEAADEEEPYVPSPKKSRKGANKKTVEVPIGNGSSRSKGEVYPPQDSWSWRKYGQKPIKGSPYPRGYYRCSSSKGCPARKQVERSRLDPTTLLITYAGDHNHPLPATTKNHHHHHHPNVSATVTTSTPPPSPTTKTAHPTSFPPEEYAALANQPDIEPDKSGFAELAGEFGWLCDAGPTFMDGANLVGPTYASTDVEVPMPIGEEDKLLFGDLGDLPESSLVFRRRALETPCCGAPG